MKPNIAIIKWSDTELLQISLEDFSSDVFSTLQPEDSYNDLSYAQIAFSNIVDDTSTMLWSVTITKSDDNSEETLCDLDEDLLVYIIKWCVDDHSIQDLNNK